MDKKNPPYGGFFWFGSLRLFNLGFFINNVLARLRIELFDFDLFRMQALVFRRRIKVASACR
jgi:hypothetical protein